MSADQARGAEILRLWVSMIDFLEDMRLSDETLDRNAEAYRKIRNTFRYLLGNLRLRSRTVDRVPYEEMEEIDRWAAAAARAGFARAGSRPTRATSTTSSITACTSFCANVTLSSFYLDIIKDRLYTLPAAAPGETLGPDGAAPSWPDLVPADGPRALLHGRGDLAGAGGDARVAEPVGPRPSVHAETFSGTGRYAARCAMLL